jgi:nitroreductase
MNTVIDLLCQHRSIRAYRNQPITDAQLSAILDAGRAASTSSLLQCSSIIRITEQEKRDQLATLAGEQPWISQAAEFWVFCADFNRHKQIYPAAELGMAEQLLIGAVDTALMAQNCLLAAESLGLGGVFIGGIRNNPELVSQLLQLPLHVIPLFGLCLGWPDSEPQFKPRLPVGIIMHENSYSSIDKDLLAAYDKLLSSYYQQRESASRSETWSEMVVRLIGRESRPHMLEFLHKQGFITR